MLKQRQSKGRPQRRPDRDQRAVNEAVEGYSLRQAGSRRCARYSVFCADFLHRGEASPSEKKGLRIIRPYGEGRIFGHADARPVGGEAGAPEAGPITVLEAQQYQSIYCFD